MRHKRVTLDIPDVSLNQTLFQKLEDSFILLRNDGLLDGMYVSDNYVCSYFQNVYVHELKI